MDSTGFPSWIILIGTRRIAVKSTFVVPETIESNYADSDDQVCEDCTFHREVC